jgi:hypothetical protein
MEEEKGTVAVADGSELQQALQNAVNQSSKSDRLLEKVNELQAQIQETSKWGVHLKVIDSVFSWAALALASRLRGVFSRCIFHCTLFSLSKSASRTPFEPFTCPLRAGSKLETKRYTKLLKIYREALESSERELTCVSCFSLCPFRLAMKSEFVNAEFVYLFPTRGLKNWFLKLALTTVSMSSPYFFAGGTG